MIEENIIARTNAGGNIWEVPITITADNRESIREGEILTIGIKNTKTMVDYLIAGSINDLQAANQVEDTNRQYVEYTRSRSNEVIDIDEFSLEDKLQYTTYFNGVFKVLNVIESHPVDGLKAINGLPRPILPGESIVNFGDFLEKLESTLDKNKYAKFGRIPSKKIEGDHYNQILKPNHDNSAKHIGIFAETGNGKSTALQNLLNVYSETSINLCGIDPKSEMYNETLASGSNFIEKVTESGRKVFNLSIFDDISLDLNTESITELAAIFSTFNDRATFNIGNKHKFRNVFCELLLEDHKNLIEDGQEITQDVVTSILNRFKEDSVGSRVYTAISNKKPLKSFQEKIDEVLSNPYKITAITNNLNSLTKYFSKSSDKWTIDEINEEFLKPKSGNKSLIFIHPGSKNNIPDHLKENYLVFIVSKLLNSQKKLLSDSSFESTNGLFFADEANLYFPKKNKNRFQVDASNDLKELLNNWARSKGLGFALVNPDPTQLDDEIFERIINKIVLFGHGLKHSVVNEISRKLTPELLREFKSLEPLVEDENGLMVSCQFFAIGLKSALDPTGSGMLIEFRIEDF